MNGTNITEVRSLDMTGTGNIDGAGNANINNFNEINANVKNFDIEHPSKEGWRLRYSVLEGPEVGIYIRGKIQGNEVITLPDYWTDLIYHDSISVQLTPIEKACVHYVKEVNPSQITIGCECGEVNAYYTIFAERKLDPRLVVEYKLI